MTESAATTPNQPPESLRNQIRSAVIWRSGTQILGQILTWASTFLVIRILDPQDYGLFAMTQVVLVLLNMLNGYGLSSALIRREDAGPRAQRQLLGMLVLLNFGLAAVQFVAAPLAAAYYRQPIVADLLRVQALLYLFTPFIALPVAMLQRELDFRRQAQATFIAALIGALAALAGAFSGLGVWTLVLAPIAMFGSRALLLTLLARSWMWPSFDFRGAGDIARFGGFMAVGQIFWFLQSQADVLIAGRAFDPHTLGIYTTSLFLAQIVVAKFVPAINDVAFSAYAKIQHDRSAMATGFAKSARIIMVVAMPFYLGLAATADSLVIVVLGWKWVEAAPIVHWLALAMPFMTLQILFAPATDAAGRPAISTGNALAGAIILPIGFLAGIQWGLNGLIAAWLIAYPIFTLISAWRSLPVIGLSFGELGQAIAPPVLAAAAMGLIVSLVARLLPWMHPLLELATLASIGALIYGAWLAIFARETLTEVIGLVRSRAG